MKKLDNINLHVQEIDSKIRRNIEDKQKVDELSDRLRELEGSLNRKSYKNILNHLRINSKYAFKRMMTETKRYNN